MTPPSEGDLLALAERALQHAGGDAQATAWWERQLTAGWWEVVTTEATQVEVTCVRDGGVATVTTALLDDDGLRRAAAGAAALAGARGRLPGPARAGGRPASSRSPSSHALRR